MIYLIAGVPRAGKSLFAKRLCEKLKITRIDFDDITQVFQNIVPEYGLFMEMEQNIREQKAYSIVETLIGAYQWKKEDLIIEGDNFCIKDWSRLKNICKNGVKMCVFGYDEITAEEKIKINTETIKDLSCWFEPLMIEQKNKIAQEMIDRSKKIKMEVESENDQDNLRYFNTHSNFEKVLEEAMKFCTTNLV